MTPARRSRPRNALHNRRLLERLRLLCSCGVGLEAIAGPACAAARDLVGAASGSIFWFDKYGEPAGFYHDCAPVELKELFVTHFDELFSAPGQFNMVTFIEPAGPPIGKMMGKAMIAQFRESNVYKYLCAPLGHRHALDVRIEHEGRGLALMVLWNEDERPFVRANVAELEPVRTLLEQAVRTQRETVWCSTGSRSSYFITDISGERITAISPEAEGMLRKSQMLRQMPPEETQLRRAPAYARLLAAMLAQGGPAEICLPVANGRLVARASPSARIGQDGNREDEMFVSVDIEMALNVMAVERIAELPLTYMQKQIMLFCFQGGTRNDCEDRFGVSHEALKKHLRVIYDATRSTNWTDLRTKLSMP